MHNKKSLPIAALVGIALILGLVAFTPTSPPPPRCFHWQAVIRDGAGKPIANRRMNFEISIVDSSSSTGAATTLYIEDHIATTNQFGLVNLQIGCGMRRTGNFDALDWNTQKYWLRIRGNPEGGQPIDLGKSQILPMIGATQNQSIPDSLLAKGGRFVGSFPVFGFDEGAAHINSRDWQVVTRTQYTRIEDMFLQPVLEGTARKYYLVIRKADNIDACADSTEWRFWFDWVKKPGHQFKGTRDWGGTDQGHQIIMEIPGIIGQIPTEEWGRNYWRLEARIPSNCLGKTMRVFGVSVMAIDVPNGIKPAIMLNRDAAEGKNPVYSFGGPNGILEVNPDGYFGLYGQVAADVSSFSGIKGRDAIYIKASNDNTTGVILVNKPNLTIWSASDNGLANFECRDASVRILTVRGADIIEEVYSDEDLQPGEVVVIDPSNPNYVKRTSKAYDATVIGVVSGAGGINHGMKLSQPGVLDGNTPFAIAGRVYVKVTGKVKPGNMLTTSDVPGHAQRARYGRRSFGAIIGKALTHPNKDGLVLMMVQGG